MKINITRRHLEVFITESATVAQRNKREYELYNDVVVLVTDPVPDSLDLPAALKEIQRIIPRHLVYGLDSVFIGQFPEFKERQINAFYRDGAIYITNDQDDADDFIDDFVHEVAHLAESNYVSIIYGDEKVTREFLGKRQKLFHLLRAEGYKVDPKDFMQTDYSYEFDMFLFEKVGYPTLTTLTMGLFLTPYGTTSLREYFAESFEYYFLREPEYVQTISPMSYGKIQELLEVEQ